jgi:hypothetical protein
MLTTYRRHTKDCPHKARSYWRCRCPIWVQGTLRGEPVRRALDVTSREAASNLVAAWNAAGEIGQIKVIREEPPRIDVAAFPRRRLFIIPCVVIEVFSAS